MGVPDLEDITDLSRFCADAYFPTKWAQSGKCTEVIYTGNAEPKANRVLLYRKTEESPNGELEAFTFSDVLQAITEYGPYRSRMVQHEANVFYVHNTDVSERYRQHGLRIRSARFRTFNQIGDDTLAQLRGDIKGFIAHNTMRSTFPGAVTALNNGTRIGCALSDTFALYTTDKRPNIQVAYKQERCVGVVSEGYAPNIEFLPKWQHLQRLTSLLVTP